MVLPMRSRVPSNTSVARGVLYVVSTPIGDPRDITLRALDVLKSVDLVAAEDPARTQALLRGHGIGALLTSYHNLNKEEKTAVLLRRMEEGSAVALVCDAGTPLVGDPGSYLVAKALRAGFPVRPVPGASAVLAALSASGMPVDAFVFAGVLPRQRKTRRQRLRTIRKDPRPHVLFVSAESLLAALEDIWFLLGNRRLVLACNLTKPDERFLRGTAKQLRTRCTSEVVAGELTLIVGGSRVRVQRRARALSLIRPRVFG